MPADQTTARDTATFHRHEIEALINRALDARAPMVMRSLRWVRWSKRVKASEDALYRFHELAAGALRRFDREIENADSEKQTTRTASDYAIEFGRYLASSAERFMAEQNRAAEAGEAPNPDYWITLQRAIHEFRKRADRVAMERNEHV